MDGLSLTAGPAGALAAPALASVRRAALPEHREHGVPCIPRAVSPAAALQGVLVLDLVSAPVWEHVRASVSVPVWVVRRGWFRLQARRRVRSDQADSNAAEGSNIRRPRKAR